MDCTLYTVLLHTFVVAELVPKEARIYALIHDAPEAIVGDVPTTWKTNAAKSREGEILERICVEHGVAWPPPKDLWEHVEKADAWALAAEAHVLEHKQAEKFWPRESWCDLTYEAEYKTIVYSRSSGRFLSESPDDAARLYRERVLEAKTYMRDDARAALA